MLGLTVNGTNSQSTIRSMFSCLEEATVTVQEGSQRQPLRTMGDQIIDEEAKVQHAETPGSVWLWSPFGETLVLFHPTWPWSLPCAPKPCLNSNFSSSMEGAVWLFLEQVLVLLKTS